VLNAIQQLGGAIGVAVLGTIFFAVLRHEGFVPALRHTIWWDVVGLGVMLMLTPLLPSRARPAAAPDDVSHAAPSAGPQASEPVPAEVPAG
jgi:hypothetical protein